VLPAGPHVLTFREGHVRRSFGLQTRFWKWVYFQSSRNPV
jgi:hypothetical protein